MRGGLRTRLIVDSARLTIIAGLTALGWFDGTIYDNPPGPRRHQPLQYVPKPLDWKELVVPNCIAVTAEEFRDEPLGLGGEVEDTIEVYVDVYAQNDPLGWQLAMDVRDILLGNLIDVGRTAPVIDVYDLRQATPAPFTQVDVQAVEVDRAEGQARQWQAHWFMIRADLLDEYVDEFDALHTVTEWSDDFAPAWQRIQAIELAS